MIQDYDRPVKGYKTSEMYEHPQTVLYDNFAPKVEEEIYVETAVEVPEIVEETAQEVVETTPSEVAEEIVEEKEGEE